MIRRSYRFVRAVCLRQAILEFAQLVAPAADARQNKIARRRL